MKIKLLLLLSVFLITACSNVPVREIKRDDTVSKNMLISPKDPEITVKPNSDFTYLGKQELYDKDNTDNKYIEKVEQHTYVYASQGKAKKILIIKFYSILEGSDYTFSGLFWNFKHIISQGTILLNDNNKYSYCIGVKPSKYDDVALALIEKGFLLPDCFMIKETGRIYSSKFNKKLVISYYEDIADSGIDCQEWEWGQMSKEKKYFLEGFIKRSKESFEIEKNI
jgi:hypothetical protein